MSYDQARATIYSMGRDCACAQVWFCFNSKKYHLNIRTCTDVEDYICSKDNHIQIWLNRNNATTIFRFTIINYYYFCSLWSSNLNSSDFNVFGWSLLNWLTASHLYLPRAGILKLLSFIICEKFRGRTNESIFLKEVQDNSLWSLSMEAHYTWIIFRIFD